MDSVKLINFKTAKQVIICLIVIAFYSCNKPINEKWVYYDETNCADAWQQTSNNEVLKLNVIDYFDGKGIEIYEVEIFNDRSAELCTVYSCNCKSGRRIKCKISSRKADDIKAYGFYE